MSLTKRVMSLRSCKDLEPNSGVGEDGLRSIFIQPALVVAKISR